MLRHIINLLNDRGYSTFDAHIADGKNGAFVKETDDKVFMIILSVYQTGYTFQQYSQIRQSVEFLAVTQFKRNIDTLHIIVNRDGMFDDELVSVAVNLPNVWLLAGDTGRIYIYENQPDEFEGGIKNYLETELFKIGKDTAKNKFRLTPVNMFFVLANIIIFIFVIVYNGSYFAVYDSDIMLKMGASSYKTFSEGRWYEIITSMFLHFGFGHLFNNMLVLTYTGCELEKRIGKIPYFIVYMGSGVAGNILSLWYYNSVVGEDVVSAGASGAIFGVIGGLFIYLLIDHSDKDMINPRRLFNMIFLTIYYGLSSTRVDNAAHIGGLCFGIIGVFLLSKILHYDKLKEVSFMR